MGVQSFVRNPKIVGLVLAVIGAAAPPQSPRLEPQASGTGIITGIVVDARSGAPIPGAQLSMYQTRGETPSGVYHRSEHLVTEVSGTFIFRNLPAGQFSIDAYADGYEPGAVGKRRPRGEGVWITLAGGQTFSNARIELFRGGTISGVVTNDRGEPMSEVHIGTWQRTGSGELKSRHGATTDSSGVYRITAVPAGDHFVVAGVFHSTTRQGPPATGSSPCSPPVPPPPPGTPMTQILPPPIEKPKHAIGEWFTTLPRWIPEPPPDDRGQSRTIATTIYPGVSEVSQAAVVSIGGGEERTGVDLLLRPVVTTSIRGRILPLPGKKIGNGSEVRLRLPGAPSDVAEHTTWVQPDNTFRFVGVPPASYVLELQIQEATACDVIVRHAEDVLTRMPLDVPAGGIDNVLLPVASPLRMQGRIRFDGKRPRPEHIDIWVTSTLDGDTQHGSWDEDAEIAADGLIRGKYAIQVSDNAEPGGWFVRSMRLGQRDLATYPLSIDREDVSGVDVTMTDRPSPVHGRVVDAAGNLVRDATIVAYPIVRASWPTAHEALAGFARTRSLDGTYRFEHLVPGDYFIAAVDERHMDEWPRLEFLDSIARLAAPVRIAPGESRTLTLAITTR